MVRQHHFGSNIFLAYSDSGSKAALRLERTLDWLKAPDPSQNYNNARQRHADGTCTWFLISKEFSEWKEGARSLLWVYGIRE